MGTSMPEPTYIGRVIFHRDCLDQVQVSDGRGTIVDSRPVSPLRYGWTRGTAA